MCPCHLLSQLLLSMSALICLTSGTITLEKTHYKVQEDDGNVDVCFTSDAMCVGVSSLKNGTANSHDYTIMSSMIKMDNGNSACLMVTITDDDMVEDDETFEIQFTELGPSECNMDTGSGGSSGEGRDDLLSPMSSSEFENVLITIMDNDKPVTGVAEVAPAVIAGVVCGLLIGITLTAIIFLVVCSYCSKRKKRQSLSRNTFVDGSYFEFNSNVIHSPRGDYDGLSTTSLKRRSVESLSPTHSVHEAIADVPPQEFSVYVKDLHRNANREFSKQFAALQEHSPTSIPCTAAKLDKNFEKNRYNNILPYDATRVTLSSTQKKQSDYINASWINGYKKEKAYVSCQGPLPDTVGDFWRMVWELKIPTIVMLTKTVEATRVKCEQYWPEGVGDTTNVDGGKIIILLNEVVPYADYELRKITIYCGDETRNLVHYYFQAWPDHGVPRYATALLGFIRSVRKSHFPSDPSPLLVHCSAGVGRTGTFIVLDIMLQVLEAQAGINVYQCILKLRRQRCMMVQTEAQYIFIHDALEELITCGKTEISAANLRIAMNRLSTPDTETQVTGFQKQFELLEQVTRQPLKQDLEAGQKIVNMGKNRHPNILPYDFQRVCLRLTGQPGSDYINASWINGYRQSNTFMVTQTPLENTVSDIWRMMWETGSRTVVLLSDLKGEDEVQYWPGPGEKQSYGSVSVGSKKVVKVNDALFTRSFEICHNSSAAAPLQDVRTVTQFHFCGWPHDGLPSHPSLLLELVDRVLKNQRSTGNKPIVVMCSDGSGCSGVFVVLYSQLERLKTEHVLDVFQGVKAARTQRMGIVHNVECYKLIHQLLLEYLTSFQEKNYENFSRIQ